MSESLRRRLSNALLLLGVLAWVPYFYLLSTGTTPSVLPFLAAHLAGVLPGTWLRLAQRDPTAPDPWARRRLAARILVILGVLAWAPYFYLTRVTGLDLAIGPFLAAHLTGVLGGSALRISIEVQRRLGRGEPPPF
jgi:uncharacterized membrane protein YjjB (DUF3815 family)